MFWGERFKPTRTARSLIRSQLNPLSSRLLPLRYFSDYRLETYYANTLHNADLAKRWGSHYLRDLSLTPGALVLDHGCGRGRHVALLRQLGFRVCAQDVVAHRWWRQLPECSFQVVSPETPRLPWQSAVFSAVFDIGVIHYLDDDRLKDLVAEVRRVLAPGGYWILLEANDAGYASYLPRQFCGRLHSMGRVRQLVTGAGLSIIDVSYEGFSAPLVPRLVNFARKVAWPGPYDVSDYGSQLEAMTPPHRRDKWLLRCRKPCA